MSTEAESTATAGDIDNNYTAPTDNLEIDKNSQEEDLPDLQVDRDISPSAFHLAFPARIYLVGPPDSGESKTSSLARVHVHRQKCIYASAEKCKTAMFCAAGEIFC